VWGVGTHLVTGGGDSSLTGVYKIVAREKDGSFVPTIKVSNNPEKVTNPGIKQVWRFLNGGGSPLADLICLEEEPPAPGEPHIFHHPIVDYRSFTLSDYGAMTPLLTLKMKEGRVVGNEPPIADIRARAWREIDSLDDTYKRLINPHLYKVSLSDTLHEMKARLIRENLSRGRHL